MQGEQLAVHQHQTRFQSSTCWVDGGVDGSVDVGIDGAVLMTTLCHAVQCWARALQDAMAALHAQC